jgi:hypothetical protein
VKNPNISGIIHNIILFVEACLGSTEGIMVIFCISHIEAPTKIGIIGVGSGSAKSSQRKELLNGTTCSTCGIQKYNRCERPTRDSGVTVIARDID